VQRRYRYGRRLDDFEVGATFAHPWEVTVDDGALALFSASFQDAMPTYASRIAARQVGLSDRPVHPLLLLNLGLSFSVHDVSEQAIAHLAYLDVRFPAACFVGDTLSASSRVIGKKPVSSQDKGVVHVRTHLENQDGVVVCAFERKALVPAGRNLERPPGPSEGADEGAGLAPELAAPASLPPAPSEILERAAGEPYPARRALFPTFWEDLEVGDVFVHDVGRTVSEAEHMQLTTLARNSHPLHFDEQYCATHSFARTRVVFGGLVLSWVLALTSRDVAGNAIWDLGLDRGAHPSGVLAGDTLFAATRVLAKEAHGPHAGAVTLRVVGVKNVSARTLLDAGADLFTPELGKKQGKVGEKAVEIDRMLLVRRRPGGVG
jgi:2-methylfumaryl-CoA hydratase